MKKLFLLLLLILPIFSFAQEQVREEMFKARVIEVVDQKEITDEAGSIIQQNLKLKGLDGSFEGKEIFFEGISEFQILSSHTYKLGDKVIVSYSQDVGGNDVFFILDYDRSGPIIWLAIIFIFSVLAIGRWKGFRSLIALALSFLVILKFIIPQILNGANPVMISVVGAIMILIFAIYFTQGINKKAHIANLSLVISLLFIALLSFWFTKLAQLTGYSEEASYLVGINQGSLNLQGLLLAGILIGTLGVLDDVIISQVSTVEQLKQANPQLTNKQIYTRSLKVGIDHISSMINTLFFAYAGASLPLLMLFTQSDISGLSFSQIVNNEFIATEIIRTLLGSIGIILSVPIANYLASYFLKSEKL
ncbi:YibE/F family protein [Patescibacteria group bacterium]|nr:YibE/F family protein [Patescibacteria group bacterium]